MLILAILIDIVIGKGNKGRRSLSNSNITKFSMEVDSQGSQCTTVLFNLDRGLECYLMQRKKKFKPLAPLVASRFGEPTTLLCPHRRTQ